MNAIPKVEHILELHKFLAPHILGNELLKKFLTLQLFVSPNQGEKMHLLIIGGTATGKSELATTIEEILIGRVKVIQRDPTPAGLKEAIKKANSGIIFIDEFDKTKMEIRNGLLEVMQSGKLTITQKKDYYTYEAKECVNGLCNPIGPELDKNSPLYSQVSFSKEYYLLSRFHFIIPVYSVDASEYGTIAKLQVNKDYTKKEIINRVREVVYYVKQNYPIEKISEKIAEKIGIYVKRIKEMYPSRLVTPRLIEGFISITKARARMNLRSEVKEEDFEYIKNLYEELNGN